MCAPEWTVIYGKNLPVVSQSVIAMVEAAIAAVPVAEPSLLLVRVLPHRYVYWTEGCTLSQALF